MTGLFIAVTSKKCADYRTNRQISGGNSPFLSPSNQGCFQETSIKTTKRSFDVAGLRRFSATRIV
jgi:hypothetical protein